MHTYQLIMTSNLINDNSSFQLTDINSMHNAYYGNETLILPSLFPFSNFLARDPEGTVFLSFTYLVTFAILSRLSQSHRPFFLRIYFFLGGIHPQEIQLFFPLPTQTLLRALRQSFHNVCVKYHFSFFSSSFEILFKKNVLWLT